MQVVINISEQIKATLNNENQWTALLLAELQEIVNNGIVLPNNATNGDMIKAMFPSARVKAIFPVCNCDEVFYVPIDKVDDSVTNEMRVMKSWWNAPYKREGGK